MEGVNRGFFISIEGCEGSGKSSLIALLHEALVQRGMSVYLTREPGGTGLGEKIRALLLHDKEIESFDPRAELLLFLASRAQHVAEIIAPKTQEGITVLCDRYIDSTVAYQGYGRGVDAQAIYQLCTHCVSRLPDITLCLDVPYDIAQQRLKKRQGLNRDRMEAESQAFHERVRAGFLELAARHPNRIRVLDGCQSLESLRDQALQIIIDPKNRPEEWTVNV